MTAPSPSRVRRVLVVDSIECDLRAVFWLLQENGIEVTYAPTARAARQIVGHFDAMILEVLLDDGSGVDLAGEFLAGGKTDRVVFYADDVPHHVWREAQRLGPVLVKKAGGVMQLLDAVRTAKKPESHFPQAGDLAHVRSLEQIAREHERHHSR